MMLQQFAAFGRVGALLNHFPVVEFEQLGAFLAREWSLAVQIGLTHQTIDVFEDQSFPGVFVLIGVHLKGSIRVSYPTFI